MSSVDVKPIVRSQRFLTPEQRLSIASLVSSGRSQTDVAAQFGVTAMTVSRIMRKVRNVVNPPSLQDWKAQQTTVAVASVNQGLVNDEWVRRGDLGVKVLTGLGVYKSESTSSTTNIYVDMRDLPADWRQRGMLGNDDDAELIERMRTATDVDSRPVDDNA